MLCLLAPSTPTWNNRQTVKKEEETLEVHRPIGQAKHFPSQVHTLAIHIDSKQCWRSAVRYSRPAVLPPVGVLGLKAVLPYFMCGWSLP